jgi:uncharacterized protein (DUF885 family)
MSDTAFEQLAGNTLDEVLVRNPVYASVLGDHRYDDRLPDQRPEALEDERQAVRALLAQLDAVDPSDLSPANRVDAEILRGRLAESLYQLDDLREHEWNPLVANPGTAIYVLLARDYAPLGDRLHSLAGRLAAVPETLDVARRNLEDMPRVHIETAIVQFAGTAVLMGDVVDRALERSPASRAEVERVRPAALAALEEHRGWLHERLAELDREGDPGADPRLGGERFERKLAFTLDAVSTAERILRRAERDLVRIEREIAETAARLSGERPDTPGLVRRVLDSLAEDRPDNDTIVELSRQALTEATAFVRDEDLVTIYEDPVEIITMPEIHRGIAVAYCDPPGPLETADTPTFFAISPTPQDWPAERVDSFFREYNKHLLHNLTVHEAMPGHVLQLAHSRRCQAPTQVRAAFWSGPFVEGWAVYSERLMADRGYRGDALRMQQLKMQLRMVINAILDARVHVHGMTEAEAMRLMMERGHQEEGEAAGKWRRALLTSTQLSTYYVGFTEVSDLAEALRAARPGVTTRKLHDEMLAHGSPAPRHLRTLLGV